VQAIPVHGSALREYGPIAQNEPKIVKAYIRKTELALYSRGAGSHIIVKMFHTIGERISTKTIIRIASESGVPVRGRSSLYPHKNLYDGRKGMQRNHRWPFTGKIAPIFGSIAVAFVQWVVYCVKQQGAFFGIDAVLAGEKPP